MREKLQKVQIKRLVILNLPYFFIFYVADKGSMNRRADGGLGTRHAV